MRIKSVLAIVLFAMPLYAQDSPKESREKAKQLFVDELKNAPHITKEQVGTINTPLPDRRAFNTPPSWMPIKVVNETSVYIVKQGYMYLVPNPSDTTRSSYVLWTNKRGEEPEIVLWPCENASDRAAKIAAKNQKEVERKEKFAERQIENGKKKVQRQKERRSRAKTRNNQRAERNARPGRKAVASNRYHKRLIRLQQPLADAAAKQVARILQGDGKKVTTFSAADEKALADVEQSITATMALQTQIRDLEWCDALQKHIAPNMWNDNFRKDPLKNSDPESVALWLVREIERQTESAESKVEYEEGFQDDMELRKIHVERQ